MPTPEELLNAAHELDKDHGKHAEVAGTLRKYFEARAEEAPDVLKGDLLAKAKLCHLLASIFAAGGVAVKGEKGDKGDRGEIGPQGPKGDRGPAGRDAVVADPTKDPNAPPAQ
jgi:hypothetical protein